MEIPLSSVYSQRKSISYLFWMKRVVGLAFSLTLLGASGVDAGFFRYRVNLSS